MAWFIVVLIGAFVGTLLSFAVRHLEMPYLLCVGVGVIGALVGSGLNLMIGADILGVWSFYLSGAILSVCTLAGGIFAFSLTNPQDRTGDDYSRL